MLIEELSHDTFKQLCTSLNDGLGTGYIALMMKGFPDLYSHVDVTEIKRFRNPAEKLLCDLSNRQITVERLLRDVTKRGETLNLLEDYQFSPRHSTGQPQEHSDDALMEDCSPAIPFHKQAKTYRAPVQETVFNPLH
nr:uncharacterized protein LOC131784117 isoform X2 [Pocillopora verrucosa]